MIDFIDIITDLKNGDCGKREISYQLSKRDEYTHSMRVNGGPNSGGNVHYLDKDGNEKHIVLHQVPTGILNGKKCIIGSGCVINVTKLYNEIQEIKAAGFDVEDKIFVAKNAHLILERHVNIEKTECSIGTTRQGIGPCYSDKYYRIGVRAEDILKECDNYNDEEYQIINKWFDSILIDLYEEFYNPKNKISILIEMAQGFELDIDHGDYPFVTSSHTTVAGALLNLLPYNKVRKVYGVCKAYDTYVGNKKFQPDDQIFKDLCEIGNEKGATTGRLRQCNWLDLYALEKAIRVNSVTHLIISKLDVLEDLNIQNANKFWIFKTKPTTTVFKEFKQTKENFVKSVDQYIKDIDSDIQIQWRSAPNHPVEI